VIKKLATFSFHALGWKTAGEIPKDIKKYVIIAAPHTSNWDFLYTRLFFIMKEIPLKFFIKKEWYFFPFNIILNSLGGIPVNRKKKENLTQEVADIFSKHKELAILIPPEGTRKYNPNWKKGFYYVAQNANVPIVLGYIDYEKRIGGLGPIFYPTGDIEKDMEEIKSFYRGIKGKYPENGVR